ncbi:Cation transporter family protein [Ancylostoma caninum]|uniref:Cation transporter family protein n=1 Tax=Ancylostoma caninum TaxID=29170 RepID=A0A368H1A6_ANCCA|nr:Cation transporter family protein [Ancylostoma caninum]
MFMSHYLSYYYKRQLRALPYCLFSARKSDLYSTARRTLGGSFILPVLNKNQYDPFSAPIVFQGSAVVVRFGIYIESMSNFQTSTMDYDMDIYLMMSWRDARLVNPYDKPILVKEEEILDKIWRPDPFFANAKEAEFHEVTFLNFLMRIFPDGLVLYETRVKIKPSCNLILCKYPHDKQTCDLLIKSFAYPVETVRFEWFTRRVDAIDKNPDVKLPELYIDRYEPTVCTKARKSGAFSCLRAVFRLKRDVGFHIAQTYIPTSLALMFSWVGVWLPEEFMEGRIGVAITVLLTLSTESAGAREHLPSVSYLKAIDLWFGFITGFVFFTLLQTLFVIGFDKRANQLKKWALKTKSDMTEDQRDMMMQKAKRYHKTGRYLDNFCRVFYPLSFLLFLIMYYFVFTEGRQDDCINRR